MFNKIDYNKLASDLIETFETIKAPERARDRKRYQSVQLRIDGNKKKILQAIWSAHLPSIDVSRGVYRIDFDGPAAELIAGYLRGKGYCAVPVVFNP